MNPTYHIINGELLPASEATLHITDLSILRGFAIFDFFRVWEGKAIFIDDHLDRFFNSATLMGLEIAYSKEEVRAMILKLITKTDSQKFSIRLQLTGGYAEDAYTPKQTNLFLLSADFPHIPAEYFTSGFKVITHAYQREFPEVKTTNYLTGIRTIPLLKENKADAVLYHDGIYVRESDRSNFFIINQEGVLVTTKTKILKGITRKKVLLLAPSIIKTEERDYTLEELFSAKEMFLTSSAKGVMPVTMLDGKKVGDGKPGEITKQLGKAFDNYLQKYLERAH